MSSESLRKGGPIGKGGMAPKNVKSTSMLNTTARSTADHENSTPEYTKKTSSHKPFGTLGGRGHGGAN